MVSECGTPALGTRGVSEPLKSELAPFLLSVVS